jgi:hypothetical protein
MYASRLATIRLISIQAEVRDSTLTQDVPTVTLLGLGVEQQPGPSSYRKHILVLYVIYVSCFGKIR